MSPHSLKVKGKAEYFSLFAYKKYEPTLSSKLGVYVIVKFGPRREKNGLQRFVNNKGADQPAHTRRLTSAFVIHLLERIISKLASSEISIFYLVSVAVETGSSLAFLENPEDRFSHDETHLMCTMYP